MMVGNSRTQIDASITLVLEFYSSLDYSENVLEQVINGRQRCAIIGNDSYSNGTSELKKKQITWHKIEMVHTMVIR